MFNIFKRKVGRKAKVSRITKETEIECYLDIDGKGEVEIHTSIGFLDHMLGLLVFHGLFNLRLKAKGDREVDLHHTNEDIGIVLGQAFRKALGNKEGIKRNGYASFPMEEVVANVTVDISGRGSFRIDRGKGVFQYPQAQDGYDFKDAEHFLDSFAKNLGMNLIIKVEPINPDLHTTLEPIFKALGTALDKATQIDPRRKGIPSTKGVID